MASKPQRQALFRPDQLERLVLNPGDRPGSAGVGDCLLQRLPTPAEKETLHVEAAWRLARDSEPHGEPDAENHFREMFDVNPLSWGVSKIFGGKSCGRCGKLSVARARTRFAESP